MINLSLCAQIIYQGNIYKLSSYQNYLSSKFLLIIVIAFVSANFDLITLHLTEATALKGQSHNAPHILTFLKGNISEVYNNNTVQLNETMNVKLSFVKHIGNDTMMEEDSTHYTSVVCPIRSSAIVYAEPQINSQAIFPVTTKEHPHSISGILFCQAKNISDTLKNSSINEDLISLNMAVFDNSSCNKFEKAIESLKTKFDCS